MYNKEISIEENLRREMEKAWKEKISTYRTERIGIIYLAVYNPKMSVNEADKMVSKIMDEIRLK